MEKETELSTETKADKRVRQWTEKINVLVAASTLLFAVCATLASFKAAGYGNQVVLAQNQASENRGTGIAFHFFFRKHHPCPLF